MRAVRIALASFCAFFLCVSAALAFDPAILSQNELKLQQLRASLAETSQKLLDPVLTDPELAEFKAQLEKIRTSSALQSAGLLDPLSEINTQVTSLGPPPGDGQPEDGAVAQTRRDLNAARDKLQSIKSQLDVVTVEAEQASARVADLQREQFYERVFVRTHSIFSPTLWYETWIGLGLMLASLQLLFSNWWEEVRLTANPLGLLIIPAFILSIAVAYRIGDAWARRWLSHYLGKSPVIDDLARLGIAVRGIFMSIAGLLAIIMPIHFALEAIGYLTPRMYMMWSALATTVFFVIGYNVTARGLATPRFAELRILNLDDKSAWRLVGLVTVLSFVATSSTQFAIIGQGLYLGNNYTIGQSAAATLVMLILMSVIVSVLRNQSGLAFPTGYRVYYPWASMLTPLVWALIVTGFFALALGYLSLASFIAHQLVRTAMALTLLFLLYYFSDAVVASVFNPRSSVGSFIRHITGFSEVAIERMGLLFRTGVDLFFLVAGIPVLFIIWTLTWVDFRALFNTLALGFQVGNLRISPGIVLTVLITVVSGIVATKLFNTWLERRILSRTHIGRGVQDSILKGSSYAGVCIAVGMGLTAGGLDFSNLAIIAGALGVGIGFGLQSIVNNFVSGLIILAERPIRVGDWVAVPDGEGVVRRINVRSTEIETFDFCTIIIPNLSLVTQPVRNWTYSDNIGRVVIKLIVDNTSDPKLVQKLMTEVARSHPEVLTSPAASVLLSDIDLNGLQFDLRAYVADIMDGSAIASELRMAILQSFAENRIHIAQSATVTQAPD